VPRNDRGWDVDQTFSEVEASGKLSHKTSKYKSKAPSGDESCGACRFFLRDSTEHMGRCQAVSGSIDPFGTCDLHIPAADAIDELLRDEPDYSSQYRKKSNRYR
jgi:hypothetical protein